MKLRTLAALLGAAVVALAAADIAMASDPPPARPIGGLTRADVGRAVTVSGVVSDASNFSAGFKFALRDATGALNLTVFSSVYDALRAADDLNLGARVTVTGKLKEYKGVLEISPSRERDLDIEPPPAPVLPAAQPTGNIQPKAGQRVLIAGAISAVEEFKLGVKISVDDGSGPRWVTLFDSVLSRVRGAERLAAGQRVQVVGKVSVFRRTAEITPALPGDVLVQEAAPSARVLK
jgi:DNA/RNA endonuclease YhcR with UshA esterase domain